MYRWAKLTSAVVLTFGLCLTASGCGSADPDEAIIPNSTCQAIDADQGEGLDLSGQTTPDALAIVAANTANNPAPVMSATVNGLIEGLMNREILPSLWSASDSHTLQFELPWEEDATDAAKADLVDDYVTTINEALQTPATQPGLALFDTLTVATDTMKSAGASDPWIVLIGSGLDDHGPLDTTHGLLGEEPDAVAQRLRLAHPDLDLTNMTVLLQSFGYTAPPQSSASDVERALITTMWQTVLEEFGATVLIDPKPAAACSLTTSQTVATTEFPKVELVCAPQSKTYQMPSALLFTVGSPELSAEGRALITEPIQLMINNPGAEAQVVGYASVDGDSASNQELSEQRAANVATAMRGELPGRQITDSGQGELDLPDPTQARRVDITISNLPDGQTCTEQ
ncbi:MAG: OmpA family protein [Propionibacteriaceae bacterium]|jgi:outer membrane protein OmpA-like peptidoglycan-associated protein|nr:OmpA family protein [Propionibacteriaceae bacterium]